MKNQWVYFQQIGDDTWWAGYYIDVQGTSVQQLIEGYESRKKARDAVHYLNGGNKR